MRKLMNSHELEVGMVAQPSIFTELHVNRYCCFYFGQAYELR